MKALFASLFTILSFSLINPNSQGAETWQLRKNESGIKIYTRSVPGSDLDEFKGTCTLNASPQTLVELVTKVKSFTEWVPSCIEAKLLDQNKNQQIHYTRMEAPFPVSDRDSFYRYVTETKGKDRRVTIEALPEYGPQKEDAVRMTMVKGFWYFKDLGNGQSAVTYQVHADPGGSIPAWLANSEVVDNPFETLQNLQEKFN